jgi:peptidoglycan hydrolase-like protein with peptidoglycan-binding domain
MKRLFFFWVALGLLVATASAGEIIQAVQTRLKKNGFYQGQISGVYDSETSAAVTRFQIRNGLAISGKLDAATLNALDVPPPADKMAPEPSPEAGTWRRLRNGDMQFLKKLNAGEIAPPKSPPAAPPQATQTPVAVARQARSAAPSTPDYGQERLRDYIGAFVLAGLDPHVGAELEFFADRVSYFGKPNVARPAIRRDLERYDKRWPQRRFWLAGDLEVRRLPGDMLQVTFPLRYELRKGQKTASGRVRKTLVLRKSGDGDLEIVKVNETKA